jgi:exodeoxyribonuclease-3
MKLATWNVNSIRVRLDRVLAWIDQHQPDVLCLQEIKAEEKAFPLAAFQAKGYQVALSAQKTYNGVALLSKQPLADVRTGLRDGEDDTQARLIEGRVGDVWVINVYMPNGQHPTSEKFPYKLRWMERLRIHLHTHFKPTDPLVLTGDFNVAPEDKDVYDPPGWANESIFHPDARKGLESVRAFGFVDVFRKLHPEPGHYSWWDYRAGAFPKNQGLRIDHIFATPPLAERCTDSSIDIDSRRGDQPSDHAAVLATFA